jgi:hypothetical protein
VVARRRFTVTVPAACEEAVVHVAQRRPRGGRSSGEIQGAG